MWPGGKGLGIKKHPAPGGPSRGFAAPLLFVQHDIDPCFDVHVEERLVDRIQSPFMADEFLGRVDALVRVRRVVRRERTEPDAAPAAASGWRALGRRSVATLGRRVPGFEKPSAPYLEVAARVADWADRRDGIEPGHAERVTSFAAMIADGLEMPDGEAARLLRAAMLHDIGKVALPVEVLRQYGLFDHLADLQRQGKIGRFGASVETMDQALWRLEQEGLDAAEAAVVASQLMVGRRVTFVLRMPIRQDGQGSAQEYIGIIS